MARRISMKTPTIFCGCSPSTVLAVLERARKADMDVDWPLISTIFEAEPEQKLFPDEHYHTEKPLSDMYFIHTELKRKTARPVN